MAGAVANDKKRTRAEQFERQVSPRVNRILSELDKIGERANPSHNEYTEHQVTAIFLAIKQRVATTEAKFRPELRPSFVMPGTLERDPSKMVDCSIPVGHGPLGPLG